MADRTHACPGKCGAQIAHSRFACRADWFRLPLDLRQAITDAYHSNPGAHLAAMADAMNWYRANPQEVAGG